MLFGKHMSFWQDWLSKKQTPLVRRRWFYTSKSWYSYTDSIEYSVGFSKPCRAERTCFKVLLVVDATTTGFPLRRFIVGKVSSPTLLMLIPADISRSIKSFNSSSQYSRILQSVKTNLSLYGSNWEVYCGLTGITNAPAYSNQILFNNWQLSFLFQFW